ncbi:hypothetical protein MIV117L [Invertebrate iridescent virus 3]|uniref:Uncharacterized protein 117L n=1 Tax=Invertebrate iridescent virus 3 TaxID=345201 RepID=117L_IIV3|nr:hypothetical protein MIV117L [Invertebrate iridescent virus 3]Q196U3.1 RecName: Full=Uncharacterized protein 117L [Invertebrate iridescent virus 3]ABF82147.1 hypothetical protein MIV117L [Invertebrate iridescent virus 3]
MEKQFNVWSVQNDIVCQRQLTINLRRVRNEYDNAVASVAAPSCPPSIPAQTRTCGRKLKLDWFKCTIL